MQPSSTWRSLHDTPRHSSAPKSQAASGPGRFCRKRKAGACHGKEYIPVEQTPIVHTGPAPSVREAVCQIAKVSAVVYCRCTRCAGVHSGCDCFATADVGAAGAAAPVL